MARYRPIVEALALLAATFPLAVGLHLPTLWFLTPFAVLTVSRRSYAAYGLSVRRPGSAGLHATVIGTIFVPYAVAHWALASYWSGATLHFRLPDSFLRSVFDQVLLIGLPEEFFFRGYLQTQLDQAWGRPYRFGAAPWGVGLPVAALLFATCHLINGGPVRLIVFFPGLLYGWLRARTGTILVPALYHAGSNLLMQIMVASLSP
ncbi:MAG: myxosortase family intramembrane protease [Candidatus Binatia bacterium]